MTLQTSPKKILAVLAATILFLLVANTTAVVMKLCLGHERVYGLVHLFNFNEECNVPTLFSSCLLIACALLLLLSAHLHRRAGSPWLGWAGLAFIMLFLAIDESSLIHEQLIGPVRETVGGSGLFYYAWVIPYGLATLLLLAACARLLARLPRRTALLFVGCGAIFVSGAIGFEMLSGIWDEDHGKDNLPYGFLFTCEETLEMSGIALFIYALLSYLTRQFDGLTLKLGHDPPD